MLGTALEKAGLRVFLDENSIDLFEPITAKIEGALRSSTAFLAYYSTHYTSRSACQVELTAAFLAGQREGDAMRRIIVVNPDDPRSDHLMPTELADTRYGVLSADLRNVKEVVRKIKDRVDGLSGTIGEVRFDRRYDWFGRTAGTPHFVGRYRDQWALHTALSDAGYPLTRMASSSPVAALIGMPGIGKTSLAAAYAWNFGSVYADGAVCWVSLAGAGPTDVVGRFEDEVRNIAEAMRFEVDGLTGTRVRGLVADALDRRPGPSLWVVDDVPRGLDPDVVRKLIPGGSALRVIITTRTNEYRDLATTVQLEPMNDEDVGPLLAQFRMPLESEQVDFERLVPKLRGHPMAVRLAGNHLRDRIGLLSFAQYAQQLADSPDTLAVVADQLMDSVRGLSEAARLVLQLALAGARTALPARFIGPVVERLVTCPGNGAAGGALVELKDRGLAVSSQDSWQVHTLVLDAARRHLDAPVPSTDLARTAAGVLEQLAADPTLTPSERADVMQHAAAVAPSLSTDHERRLLTQVADYYENRGEPILAAPHRDRLVELDPTSGPDLAAAAAVHLAIGEYERAVREAQAAIARAGVDRVRTDPVRRTMAEALDALARYEESELHWLELLKPSTDIEPIEMLRSRRGRLRNLRLRGRMADVRTAAPALFADAVAADRAGHHAAFDLAQEVELDVARAELLTDDQGTARSRAAAVFGRYTERGTPGHTLALAAQEVLAEARLTMHLWELNPDKDHWRLAVKELRELRKTLRQTHGDTNPISLAVTVDLCFALISQGHREEGRREVDLLRPRLENRLGPQHPQSGRAVFLDGLLHAQNQRPDLARPLFDDALGRQTAALGRGHAHTLRTQYELAVACKLLDDERWLPLMREVKERSVSATGRKNDLYVQACLALGLLRLPTEMIRVISRWGRARS